MVTQLVDEVGIVIDIPTFHVFGCDDAFLGSAVALYNICDPSKSAMFDHGLGHIVPRDADNVRMLADILQVLIPKVEEYQFDEASCRSSRLVNGIKSEGEDRRASTNGASQGAGT